MEKVLLELLRRLEAIAEQHEEVFDSDVRDAMWRAVFKRSLRATPKYVLGEGFQMYSEKGDQLVRDAHAWFVPAAREAALREGLDTFQKRLAAFLNPVVRTEQGNDSSDFFGRSDPKRFDEDGNVIPP